MQQWLTVIIVLLIIAVLLDGIRRMRQSRRSSIKMSLSMHKGTSKEELQAYGSELPNGGARVVTVRKPVDAAHHNDKVKNNRDKKKQTVGRPQPRIPQQVALNLEESVPMLMDSVTEQKKTEQRANSSDKTSSAPRHSVGQSIPRASLKSDNQKNNRNTHITRDLYADMDEHSDDGRIEPKISGFNAALDDEEIPSPRDDDPYREESADEILGLKPLPEEAEDHDDYSFDNHYAAGDSQDSAETFEEDSWQEATAQQTDADIDDDEQNWQRNEYQTPLKESEAAFDDFEDDEEDKAADGHSDAHYIEPELVLVINVMAPKGEKLRGEELLQVILNEDMRFGSMDIFHRHAGVDGDGAILYSMANIVVPGTFDLKNMHQLRTPGVSLFLALPLEAGNSSLDAFNKMVRTARAISQQLGAELKDENRSVLTGQTVEHYRQRISDFERKQLSKAPA